MKRKVILLGVLLLLLGAGLAVAADAPSAVPVLHRFVALSGGQATSADYELTAVIGQPAAGVSGSADFRLSSGFLPPPLVNQKVWIAAVFSP